MRGYLMEKNVFISSSSAATEAALEACGGPMTSFWVSLRNPLLTPHNRPKTRCSDTTQHLMRHIPTSVAQVTSQRTISLRLQFSVDRVILITWKKTKHTAFLILAH